MPYLTIAKYVLPLLALVCLYFYGDYHGHKAADTSWQARWQARDLADAKGVAAELASQKALQAAQKAKDEEVLNAHAKELSAALAANGDLASRLRRATAAHGGCPVPGTAPPAGSTPATGDGDQCSQAIERDSQRVYDAAIQCAATLTALQADCR